ncbi:MAG: hypothetical protein WC755_06675 [Candidatus Woesearchaeota archaeon]
MQKTSYVSVILSLLLMLPVCFSDNSYITEEITIAGNGDSSISGTTNVNFLKDVSVNNEAIIGTTSELTKKDGKKWTFYYNAKRNVSKTEISVSLPKNAVINYISSPLLVYIQSSGEVVTIEFTGNNKPAEITIQYEIMSNLDSGFFTTGTIIIGIIVLIMIIASIVFLLNKKKSNKKENIEEKKNEEHKTKQTAHHTTHTEQSHHGIDMDKLATVKLTLNETQLKIIDALLEKKGEAKQTVIMYMTNIPKASLSRNVELLAQKNIVEKFYNGTSNFIKIHPQFRK